MDIFAGIKKTTDAVFGNGKVPMPETDEPTNDNIIAEEDYKPLTPGAEPHDHKWVRGMLPGGVYVKVCKVDGCTARENIEQAEWQATPTR